MTDAYRKSIAITLPKAQTRYLSRSAYFKDNNDAIGAGETHGWVAQVKPTGGLIKKLLGLTLFFIYRRKRGERPTL
jgi:hypothetical protein